MTCITKGSHLKIQLNHTLLFQIQNTNMLKSSLMKLY